MVLVYGEKPEAEQKVFCYADASFQTDKDDTKSQTGYVFVLNGGTVDWKSAKQSTVVMSSTEVEYIATTEASIEAMLCDNEPAIAIAKDLGILKGARHFQRKYHYIHEVIQEREIVLKEFHTDDNVADPFTKPMSYDKNYEHAMAIGIVPVRSLMIVLLEAKEESVCAWSEFTLCYWQVKRGGKRRRVKRAQPEDSNELFQKLLEDLKELAEYKESLENPSNEIATSSFNTEKEEPPQNSNIRQLIREECCVEVSDEQKQKMEDTILELVEICRQKELFCMHDNVDDLIESALNSKLLSINSQRLDKKEQEVKNVVEQPAERGNRIVESLQNFRVIHKSSISLNNTSQISLVAPVLPTEEPEHSLSMGECEVTSDDESECDMPAKDDSSLAFTTFSNPLFKDNDDFDSSDDESLPEKDVPAEEFKVYSNPLFDDDEINSDKLDPHCFNVESDFVESLFNRDTFIDSSSKIDFSGKLAHVNPEITESDFDFKEEIHISESLLYVNSTSQPPEEHNAEEERIKREHVEYISRMEMLFTINPRPHPTVNANTNVESIPSLPIPVQDSDSQGEKIDISTSTDDVLPPSVENDDDSDREVDVVDDLRVDNYISNSEHESSESEESDFDNLLVPLPPLEPPDEELNFEIDFGDEISVARNTIVEFECINAKVKFDVSNDENDDYSYFMFVKVFSFLFAESEDTIFYPGKDCAQTSKNQSKTGQYQHKNGSQQQKPDQ
nr:hypothetical protein [Tanacetum cinerariifolium]